MNRPLTSLFMLPLLFWQGRQVRRATPRLPEPPGAREGWIGRGPPLRLMILGDSAAAGVGAATQAEALSGRVTEALQKHFHVRWRLTARTGATLRGTLAHLSNAAAREPFDVVVTSLGVNDVTSSVRLADWVDDLDKLAELLRTQFATRRIIVSGVPPMQDFPALPQPLRGYLGRRAMEFDRALEQWARQTPDAEYLKFNGSLAPGMMAADGFHPGPRVYAAWGAALAERIVRRFA